MNDEKVKALEEKIAELQADNELLKNNLEYKGEQVEKMKFGIKIVILCILFFVIGYCTNDIIELNKQENNSSNYHTYTKQNDFDNTFFGL